jgi:hypothetical protein
MGESSEAGMGIGAPDGETNWTIFVDTMREVTVPGLEGHGLRAHAAWREALRRFDERRVRHEANRPERRAAHQAAR